MAFNSLHTNFFLFLVQPSIRDIWNEQSSLTQPILYVSFTVFLWTFFNALVSGDLRTLDISHAVFFSAGAAAAISLPYFTLPLTRSRYPTKQASDVPAPRPPPPGLAQPSEQVPGEDSTMPAQDRQLEQDARSWSLDLESVFAAEEEQRLL